MIREYIFDIYAASLESHGYIEQARYIRRKHGLVEMPESMWSKEKSKILAETENDVSTLKMEGLL